MRKNPDGKRSIIDLGLKDIKTLRIGTLLSGYLSRISAVRTALRMNTSLESVSNADKEIRRLFIKPQNQAIQVKFTELIDHLAAFVAGDETKLENKELRAIVRPLLKNDDEKNYMRLKLYMSDIMSCGEICEIVCAVDLRSEDYVEVCKRELLNVFEKKDIIKKLNGNAVLSMRALTTLLFDAVFKTILISVNTKVEWKEISAFYECSIIVVESAEDIRQYGETFDKKIIVMRIDDEGNYETIAELLEYNLDQRTFAETDPIITALIAKQS